MTTALFIIDVQNDFTEGGALGVDGGEAVAAGITAYLAQQAHRYDYVFASRDWHDGDNDNGGHFATDEDPDFRDTWPVHCVADTHGAQYHAALDTSSIDIHIYKGQGEPAYSIFEGTAVDGQSVVELINALGIDQIDVVGIATDYCVRASALDALDQVEQVRVFSDLVAGVAEATTEAAFEELAEAEVEVLLSEQA